MLFVCGGLPLEREVVAGRGLVEAGDRPGLKEMEIRAGDSEFDVAVAPLDTLHIASQLAEGGKLCVGEGGQVTPVLRDRLLLDATSGGEANHGGLGDHQPLDDIERGAIERESVGGGITGDDAFAETVGSVDEDAVRGAGDGVAGEEDAGGLRSDLALDQDGHARGGVRDAPLIAVGDGMAGVGGSPDGAHTFQDVFTPGDVEVAAVLAGEAGTGQVLRSAGGADGDGGTGRPLGGGVKAGVGAMQGVAKGDGDLEGGDKRSDFPAGGGERGAVLGTVLKERVDAGHDRGECIVKGGGGYDESRRDREAGLPHTGQGSGLFAHQCRFASVRSVEVEDQGHEVTLPTIVIGQHARTELCFALLCQSRPSSRSLLRAGPAAAAGHTTRQSRGAVAPGC